MAPPPCPPRYLYKYVGTRTHHFEIIEKLEIRFGQPSVMNDPLDCQPEVIGPKDPVAAAEAILQRNLARGPTHLTPVQIDAARAKLIDDYTIRVADRIALSEATLRKNLDVVGFLSLSSVADNLLMWAHYGEQHFGFVIEFDTRFKPLVQKAGEASWQGLPVPVDYRPKRPQVHCDAASLQLPKDLLVIKHQDWAYEREWRVIRDRAIADRTLILGGIEVSLFAIDPQAISSIYIGKDASTTTESRIRAAVAGNNALAHVRVARARLHPNGSLVFT